VDAVKQLIRYLKEWQFDPAVRKQVKEWALRLGLKGVDETTIDDILDQPIGVLIGTNFQAEAIRAALDSDFKQQIRGLRLARFRGTSKSEYYVIAEDQMEPLELKRNSGVGVRSLRQGLLIRTIYLF